MERYLNYNNIISEITQISKFPKVTRKENLIRFTEIKVLSILLRVIWVTIIHLVLTILIWQISGFGSLALIYFALAIVITIYRSSISYNTYIIDTHKRIFYWIKYRKVKYKSPFSDIETVAIKITEHKVVTQHEKLLTYKDYEYNLQIVFKDKKELVFGDFNNLESANKYKALFLGLLE